VLLSKSCNCVADKGKVIPLKAWAGPEDSSKFRTTATGRWQGCQPYAPAAFTTQKIFLVLFSVTGWVDPRAIVQPKDYVTKNFQ